MNRSNVSMHTPGPWTVLNALPGEEANFGIIARGCSSVLAEAFSEFHTNGDFRIAEARANAHLISAAPEMYNALIHICTLMQVGGVKFLDQETRDKIANALNKVAMGSGR